MKTKTSIYRFSKHIFYLLLATGLFLVIGCSKITEGEIVERWHRKPYQQLVLIPMKVGDITIMQQYWIYHGDAYCVKIKGYNRKQKEVKRTFYLDKDKWDTFKVGDFVKIERDFQTDDPTQRKEKVSS
jgi:hypothetical protein